MPAAAAQQQHHHQHAPICGLAQMNSIEAQHFVIDAMDSYCPG